MWIVSYVISGDTRPEDLDVCPERWAPVVLVIRGLMPYTLSVVLIIQTSEVHQVDRGVVLALWVRPTPQALVVW